VLDYSGSMSWDDKYVSMADAAKDIIDRSQSRDGDTMRVGIVPFSEYVLTPLQGQYAFDVFGGASLMGVDIVGCMLNRQFPHSVAIDTPSSADQGSLWPVTSYTTGGADGASSYSDPYSVEVGETSVTVDGVSYSYEFYALYPSMSAAAVPGVMMESTGGPTTVTLEGYNKFTIRWVGTPPPNYALQGYHAWSNVPTNTLNR